jgi:hypothetical protein
VRPRTRRAPALAQTLTGASGTSLNKVLVIGTDGTRWDLLDAAMKAGGAATARVNGISVAALRGRLQTVSLAVRTGRTGGSLVVTTRNGKLAIPAS